ncbi:MAG TPA: PilX N-terminal domain-containing pilus assembly protein [Terriglobales bacterium]|nr:PilX N-terminal domain-containing pilus assembly protein [Terriglobales bacterium]
MGVRRAQGFTLIAALLLLLLMSGLAVGLMYMTNTEVSVGGNDRENELAFYGAEAGMEKMTSDLGNLYTANQAPTVGNITALQAFQPSVAGISYSEYTINVPLNAAGQPAANTNTISSGPNQGLVAEIIPMTLNVTSQRPGGAEVRMVRTVEVAEIPVFQFGVFSDSDLSYFAGPDFDFAGRAATNHNLYVADGGSLIFHSKVTAAGEVIRDTLANGVNASSTSHGGPVYVPNATAGCDSGHPATHCRSLALTEGSYNGGPPPTGTQNTGWTTLSTNTYNGWILNGATGAKALTLPFVGAGISPIQIIRKPPATEVAGSSISVSRLYNKAQIRVLLADTEAQLAPERPSLVGDADNIQLNEEAGAQYPSGVAGTGFSGSTHFAYANTNSSTSPYYDPNTQQIDPPKYPSRTNWPLVDGWLRVEYKDAAGVWHGITREWLGLGFARGLVPPASVGGNTAHPEAILILQQLADRNASETISGSAESSNINTSRYNWYPINMYDVREGEVRDTTSGKTNGTCAVNGVMNLVELDVGNLKRWLTGAIGTKGTQVDNQTLNGYALYFSDRRGAVLDPNVTPQDYTGEYGFEDTINSPSGVGTPDGALDATYNWLSPPQSPEDVDQNGVLDDWGAAHVGDAFGVNTNTNPPNPFGTNGTRISCMNVARKNQVTGPRHALRLVDGTSGNLPTRPDGTGGFTVASENPVYVLGNYNANTYPFPSTSPAAASVIADAVTLLSNAWQNNWGDYASFLDSISMGSGTSPSTSARNASQSYYRLAIAAGKNVNFRQPTSFSAASDYGTDGGLHNFLRYLENWGGTNIYYQGSLVSLFYSQYATSAFKCCTVVYGAPYRNYSFDTLFLNPNNLPPATPEFQDVNNTTYRQDFTPY